MNNFNFVAPFYDDLVQLVFGRTLYQASIHDLARIPANSKILVLGGGTGKLLTYLRESHVAYVEKAGKMIDKARERKGIGTVDFIRDDFLSWQTDQQFDVVICPFFLDVFTLKNLEQVLIKIRSLTTQDGKLIVTDFQQTDRIRHRILLKLMHWFFRITVRLEGRELAPINDCALKAGFEQKSYKTFREAFIFSSVYQAN